MNEKPKVALKAKSSDQNKIVVRDPEIIERPDRISINASFEVMNGFWVGCSLESDVRKGETLKECRKRVSKFVDETLIIRAEEVAEANNVEGKK